MSLATSIKDFSDTFNHIHSVNASPLSIYIFLQEIFFFIVKTFLSGIVYVFTFEWFKDFSYLPLFNPICTQQIQTRILDSFRLEDSIKLHNSVMQVTQSIPTNFFDFDKYRFTSFFADPISHLFSFSAFSKNQTNYIFSGLINSFFFSLPFSLPHLISIRRLFSQGIQAAFFSLIGTITAHSIFLISIFYGLRPFIIPWFSLEPITYLLGFTVNVLVIKELIQAKPLRLKKKVSMDPNTNSYSNLKIKQPSQKDLNNPFSWFKQKAKIGSIFAPSQLTINADLVRIGVFNFVLTWCEELNMFSSITNLTFNSQNTYLDLYPSNDISSSFIAHTLYLLAFILGNCVFSFLFYYILFHTGSIVASLTNLTSKFGFKREKQVDFVALTSSSSKGGQNRKIRYTSQEINQTINQLVMLFIITFTFASFPYYGLDYLFGKIGGFLPEDPVYKESILSPTKIHVNKKNTLFIKAESTDKKKQSSLIDINNFDNGIYLNNIDFYKFDNFPSDSTGSISRTTSFEKSNYRQENAWIRRNYLAKLRARPRKNDENNSTTAFHKAFKEPKAYYQKVQLESDRKQSQNERETQSKRSSGYFTKRQEGVLVKEPFITTSIAKSSLNKKEDFVTPKQSSWDFAQSNLQTNWNQLSNSSVGETKKNELEVETNIFGEKYTKGVKKKSSALPLQKTKSLSTKNIIKRKFFLNPIYRSLLETDIDAFLARQPIAHTVADNQNYDLHKKRILLERYYNWLRDYSPLQDNLQIQFDLEHSTPKSFVDSAFHHQFKGTFKIVKRLFPITFDLQQNSRQNRVLSYDQALYTDLPAQENPFLHEELCYKRNSSTQPSFELPKNSQTFRDTQKDHLKDTATNCSVIDMDQVQFEELDPKLHLQKPYSNLKKGIPFDLPFIEESESSPFYAGWDDTLRRFVITNNFGV